MGRTASTDKVSAALSADAVRVVIHPLICQECEGVCYSLRFWSEGALHAASWRTDFTLRDHITLDQALVFLAKTAGLLGLGCAKRQRAIDLREQQPALW